MKIEDIKKLLSISHECPSKWELDNITWANRHNDSKILLEFLRRIDFLNSLELRSFSQDTELARLLELLEDINQHDAIRLLSKNEEQEKNIFLENLARTSAIEVLTMNKLSFETMETSCKLSPNDFIICAKRTQEIINSVRELVIKGESLSSDIPGA